MRALFTTITIAVFAMRLGGASAGEIISDRTTCTQARAIMDAEPPDLRQVRAIATYIGRTFSTLDGIHIAHGGSAIIGHMSANGRQTMIAAVTVRCEDHPDETLQRSTVEVFDGIVAMQKTIGVH